MKAIRVASLLTKSLCVKRNSWRIAAVAAAWLLSTNLSAAQEVVQILQVTDSETIKVTYKQKTVRIKLIGVKILAANEIATRARYLPDGETRLNDLLAEGKKAANYLKSKLKRGDQLSIDDDGMKKDTSGRMLVYLFTANQKILNAEVIKEGYGFPRIENLKPEYKDKYLEAADYAVSEKKGLWELWKSEHDYKEEAKKEALKYANHKKVSIMSFNVQNLFDNKHDLGKNDYAFLPFSQKSTDEQKRVCEKLRGKKNKNECFTLDWSDGVLATKLERLAAVITEVNNGAGPDILLLQEVENYNILQRLNKEYLANKGYEIIHFESLDYRGIDVAVMSRLKLAELPSYHEIPFKKGFNTRGILECTFFMPNKDLLTVLAMHLPAQMTPAVYRQKSMKYVTLLAKKFPAERLIIAGGDTNISSSEESSLGIVTKIAEPFWRVSHKIGCRECKGTFFFSQNESWSFFDVFFFSPNMVDGSAVWKVNTDSIRLANKLAIQNSAENTPLAYDPPDFKGVSDHFPLYAEIESSK